MQVLEDVAVVEPAPRVVLDEFGPEGVRRPERFVVDDPPDGSGNLMGDPAFVAAGDFHIGPTSAARDAANPAATSLRDIDGEPRPLGAGRDIGADEIP